MRHRKNPGPMEVKPTSGRLGNGGRDASHKEVLQCNALRIISQRAVSSNSCAQMLIIKLQVHWPSPMTGIAVIKCMPCSSQAGGIAAVSSKQSPGLTTAKFFSIKAILTDTDDKEEKKEESSSPVAAQESHVCGFRCEENLA